MRMCIAICAGLLVLGFASDADAAGNTDKSGARRLEDIHIEGEIPVPQVLFVTGRDQRRFMDFQHRRYLKSSLEVGRAAVYPSWITLVGNTPIEARKETTP